MYSHSIESCVARPLCQSSDYKLTSLDDVIPNTKYLGDSKDVNWVSDGAPQQYDNGILLTMPPNSAGTLLSSVHYVWYGKIETTMKTSRGQGVVTAFIMMSDVKDEIDFEFIGSDNGHAQSNFYWQGTLNYTNEVNLTASSTDSDTHTYSIDWSPDKLTWAVDGDVLRTLNKADTWNTTTNSFQYPQTPSRIQLSLWPAGESKNGDGVVDWAGGLIDWNSPYMSNGYYSALITEVNVQCYDPPDGANVTGKNGYSYNNIAGLNNSIAITDDNQILHSFFATGEDPGVDPNPPAGDKPSSSASAGPVNTNVATVPGGGAGGQGTSAGESSSSNNNGANSAPGAGGSSTSVNGGTNGDFSQGLGSNGGYSSGGTGTTTSEAPGQERLGSSAFAVVVALVGLMVL
ncbi:MAG: hypothetical protein Q9162_003422 [Coniocarpon cinnabarinum]